MKKNYEEPIIEVIEIVDDVVTASEPIEEYPW